MRKPIDPRCVGKDYATKAIALCGSPLNIEDVAERLAEISRRPTEYICKQAGKHG